MVYKSSQVPVSLRVPCLGGFEQDAPLEWTLLLDPACLHWLPLRGAQPQLLEQVALPAFTLGPCGLRPTLWPLPEGKSAHVPPVLYTLQGSLLRHNGYQYLCHGLEALCVSSHLISLLHHLLPFHSLPFLQPHGSSCCPLNMPDTHPPQGLCTSNSPARNVLPQIPTWFTTSPLSDLLKYSNDTLRIKTSPYSHPIKNWSLPSTHSAHLPDSLAFITV